MKWLLAIAIVAACHPDTAQTAQAAMVTSLAIAPASPSVASARPLRLTATATLDDGSTIDVTAKATWTSSVPATATVTPGVLHGIAAGGTTITASFDGAMATTPATVTTGLVALALEPDRSLIAGHDVQLVAVGQFADGTHHAMTFDASWTSSAPAVASVEPAGGFVHTLAPGSTTITAAIGPISATTTIAVSAAVLEALQITTTASNDLYPGDNGQIVAIGTYSDRARVDLSSQVAWVDDEPGSLSISASGAIHAIEPGPHVYIHAELAGLSSNWLQFDVFNP